MLCCMALGLPGGIAAKNYFNAFLAVVIFILGIRVLRAMVKFDPKAFSIFQRVNTYHATYKAVSQVLVPDKELKN